MPRSKPMKRKTVKKPAKSGAFKPKTGTSRVQDIESVGNSKNGQLNSKKKVTRKKKFVL